MQVAAFALAVFLSCAASKTCLASDGLPASGPSNLYIDHLDLPNGTQATLGVSGQPEPFLINVVLNNPSDSPINIWDPERNEGSRCPKIILIAENGQQTILKSDAIPQMGPPFSVVIPSHSTYGISRDLSKLNADHLLLPGKYSLKVIYQNRTDAIGPVRNVWTGSIASKDYKIEIVGPK